MNKLLFIDALRGLAALYVLLLHFFRVPGLNIPYFADTFVRGGRSGVYLFFIVSAFSLWYTMPRHLQKDRYLLSYFVSRIFRIAPLFYFFVILMSFHGQFNVVELFTNLTFTNNLIDKYQSSLVWAGWTISVEMLFYLTVPFLYSTIVNIKSACILFVLTLCLAFLTNNVIFTELSFIRFLPVFSLGIIAFFVYKQELNLLTEKYKNLANYLFVPAFSFLSLGIFNIYTPFGVYCSSLGYAFLLIAISIKPLKIFVNPIICFYGRISFSVYLTHPLVIFYSIDVYKHIYSLGHSELFSIILSFSYTILVVTTLAYLLYECIEKPAINLGKYIINRQ